LEIVVVLLEDRGESFQEEEEFWTWLVENLDEVLSVCSLCDEVWVVIWWVGVDGEDFVLGMVQGWDEPVVEL
jgi:hypothetical protein